MASLYAQIDGLVEGDLVSIGRLLVANRGEVALSQLDRKPDGCPVIIDYCQIKRSLCPSTTSATTQ
jgi:hypothetical protein